MSENITVLDLLVPKILDTVSQSSPGGWSSTNSGNILLASFPFLLPQSLTSVSCDYF